ncbi:MAG: nucleotidyltransferase family protein [Acidobacteriota bacterium]|nr:nucleotidyltransferase family protein [Acidobacteriota bacterium]
MITAVVLAAGRSSRMGRAKPLLPLAGGETFLARLARVLREGGADEVVVVIGHGAEAVREAVAAAGLDVRLVVNPAYDEGQLSSVLAGLDAADRPDLEAILMMPVDMPLVSAETVRAVIETYRRTRAPIVRPARGGRHGHPVLFDRAVFADLRQADPAVGARATVRAHAARVADVPVEDEGAFLDVDTPEEYERIRSGRAADRGVNSRRCGSTPR